MLSKDSAVSQVPLSGAPAGTAQASVPFADPRATVEAAGAGSGTVTDPGGTDHKPPYTPDFDLFA